MNLLPWTQSSKKELVKTKNNILRCSIYSVNLHTEIVTKVDVPPEEQRNAVLATCSPTMGLWVFLTLMSNEDSRIVPFTSSKQGK